MKKRERKCMKNRNVIVVVLILLVLLFGLYLYSSDERGIDGYELFSISLFGNPEVSEVDDSVCKFDVDCYGDDIFRGRGLIYCYNNNGKNECSRTIGCIYDSECNIPKIYGIDMSCVGLQGKCGLSNPTKCKSDIDCIILYDSKRPICKVGWGCVVCDPSNNEGCSGDTPYCFSPSGDNGQLRCAECRKDDDCKEEGIRCKSGRCYDEKPK